MKIKVNDMTCNHCVMSVQKALLSKGILSEIALKGKTVRVKEEDLEQAMQIIKEAGYTPER